MAPDFLDRLLAVVSVGSIAALILAAFLGVVLSVYMRKGTVWLSLLFAVWVTCMVIEPHPGLLATAQKPPSVAGAVRTLSHSVFWLVLLWQLPGWGRRVGQRAAQQADRHRKT